jgi:hypothetical protein
MLAVVFAKMKREAKASPSHFVFCDMAECSELLPRITVVEDFSTVPGCVS